MKTINIFIAGAVDLAPQRIKLKASISDLNQKYENQKKGIRFNISSYETFGNQQPVYDEYIKNQADLIIFVLEGKIGPATEKEYLLALETKNKKGKPKIVVLLNAYTETTPDIAYINGLLKTEDYYIPYNNDEDLISKTKEYLEDFIHQKKNTNIIEKITWKWISKIACVLICCFALLLGIKYCHSSPILLIAGGGSARNYIEKYHDIVLENYSNSYYVHMPSGNAWLLLTEEVITPQEKVRYCPICISASAATDDDFLKITSKDNFLASGSVIALRLGYDTLAICVKNDPSIMDILGTTCVSEGEVALQNLVKLISTNDSINIFATSPGSGTLNTYESLFASKNINLENFEVHQFSEYSDLPSINKNHLPYVLLESKCYTMKELQVFVDSHEALELKLYEEKNDNRVYSCKPIYLYFMAYAHDNTNNLRIPQQTINFLKDLDCDISGKVHNNMIKRYTKETVILDFNKLPSW